MYRFLVTPRWLGAAALAVAAAAVMVLLGNWQLDRYKQRSTINARIDAADTTPAVPLTSKLTRPTVAGAAGESPGKPLAWTKVTVTGRYDPANEIQARGRTVDSDVGFEIVTPLILADGTAVLVDRGWVPAPAGGAGAAPTVPPAPTGEITVVGQVHLSESRPTPIEHRDGRLDTRRIAVPRIAHELPYPVYGAYVLLTAQTPAADPAFTRIPIDHEDSWQNGGYAVQWWLFSGMALFAFGFQARKEAQARAASGTGPAPAAKKPSLRDRVAESDRRREATRAAALRHPVDRVAEADAAARAKLTTSTDRVESADRTAARLETTDRVELADRERAAEAERRLAAQSGSD